MTLDINGKQILISDSDAERVSQHRWREHGKGYLYTYMRIGGKTKKVYLHRFILGVHDKSDGLQVDHKNRNPRDNRRENLRLVSQAVNLRNLSITAPTSTGFRNIYRAGKKYVVQARWNGKTKTFGRFATIAEALEKKIEIWAELFGLDIREDVYRATMEQHGLDKELQSYVLQALQGVA
ncbi:HNH endonuclease signature motif containing protein [Anaerovibrio sp. JC8]|uniref:HNH endonuclease signature motif containing protein n=1 Tax=Anaerovibrio sp. JC8 TaxID=1240085 RepID=UPI000A10EF9C|nr:HNH endonuclease signature motif containing protein [Anaerovibrio sp. JC8]